MGGDDVTGAVAEQARAELERAAHELEQLTDQLHERIEDVARLEVLADALLGLVATPAVVVDAEGTVTAVSRGAVTRLPDLADAVGRAAKAAVPDWDDRPEGDPSVVVLPGGSKLVVLDP